MYARPAWKVSDNENKRNRYLTSMIIFFKIKVQFHFQKLKIWKRKNKNNIKLYFQNNFAKKKTLKFKNLFVISKLMEFYKKFGIIFKYFAK